jgi:TRAP-type C4-dicarboxylate transport system substrate-binding protein
VSYLVLSWRRALRCTALLLSLAVLLPSAAADPLRLRIVGGLAGVAQFEEHEKPFWTQELPRLTGGRATAEIVPFDQAGIRGQEMLRLMQLGVVPFGTVLLAVASPQDPLLGAADLAGLAPDAPTLARALDAFRPVLERRLRERHGLRMLAIYAYPAQVVFCRQPLTSLGDLAGRRVRTSSVSQSDLVEAVGGVPVQTAFADIVDRMREGRLDCAITGTLSGNTIGLHAITTHLHALPINWGLSVFAANAAAWDALPADLRGTLQQRLGVLERNILDDALRLTDEGLRCNTGAAGCTRGRAGRMRAVNPAADAQRLREKFGEVVLPRWLQRCGSDCAGAWNASIGAALALPVKP